MTAPTVDASQIERIRGLLKKAEATQFAEEAEIYTAKAIELMAKYSVSQAMLRMEENSGPAPIVVDTFRLAKTYETQQSALLNGIANVLHCKAVVREVDEGEQRVNEYLLYGTRDHITRVRMLHSSLVLQMLSAVKHEHPGWGHTKSQVTVYRRSWLRGFAARVLERLGDTEKREVDQVPGVGLVLATDAERAEAMVKDLHPKLKYTQSLVQNHHSAERYGRAAGDRADIGGAKLGYGRKAIGR